MDIVDYLKMTDTELTELNLACFGHTHSKERLESMIESDGRLPEWGGELYGVEDGRLLGIVGLLYPRVETKDGVRKVGGIRSVCTRPSASREGVAERLMEYAHEILREKVRYSFLMTSASSIAHELYKKLGYEDIYTLPGAFKKRGKVESNVRFRREKDPRYVRSVYKDSVKDLKGLVVREKDFWSMAESRGWPNNEEVKIAYKDGEKIGYAMFSSSRGSLSVREIGAQEGYLDEILEGLESLTDKEYLVLSHVNPAYREDIEEKGYHWSDEQWSRVMVKDLHGGSDTLDIFGPSEKFHLGIYEAF
ncbi:MAG: GNAT family N-acetyltransferase [Candidatus Natronoplasma sp.]